MWSDQEYYYSDSSFQLELNLQCVRCRLIETLDEIDAVDYDTRCLCGQAEIPLEGSRARYWFGQGSSLTKPTPSQSLIWTTPPQSQIRAIPARSLTSSGQYTDAFESPPAINLPHPEFKARSESNYPQINHVESWVRTSTPNPEKTIGSINTASVTQSGNVQDFFKSFEINSVEARFNYAQNKALMERLKFLANKDKQPEYTYF